MSSSLEDFLNSRILRDRTTWLVAAIGGGLRMYGIREAKRAAGTDLRFYWLWLERSIDFLFGATTQVAYFLCAVWMVAGLMEKADAWKRQLACIVLYLRINWLTRYLWKSDRRTASQLRAGFPAVQTVPRL